MIDYACIKDGLVVNTLIFESEDTELISTIKQEFDYDELINCNDFRVIVGFSYDGVNFYEEDGSLAMTWTEFYAYTPPVEVERTPEEIAHLEELNSSSPTE